MPLAGALGQLQTLQQLLQPPQQPLGVQLPVLLQLLQPAAAQAPSLLQQLLGQPMQASPVQLLMQVQGLLQVVAGQPAAALAGLGLPAAFGLAGVAAAPASTLPAPGGNVQSPVSPSAARGSAQYSSTKKQRLGQPGLPARLVQQEKVEVAVRPGRHALSDTSDDDYLPENMQQQKTRQQLDATFSSAAQPPAAATAAAAAAASGDMQAQHDGAGGTTRIVYTVNACQL
jgi:hypothetical protein